MYISWWRDVVIVTLGLVVVVTSVFISVLAFLLYKKLVPMMNSTNEFINKMNTVAEYANKEAVQPFIQFGTIVRGVVQGVGLITDIFRKKEDECE